MNCTLIPPNFHYSSSKLQFLLHCINIVIFFKSQVIRDSQPFIKSKTVMECEIKTMKGVHCTFTSIFMESFWQNSIIVVATETNQTRNSKCCYEEKKANRLYFNYCRKNPKREKKYTTQQYANINFPYLTPWKLKPTWRNLL